MFPLPPRPIIAGLAFALLGGAAAQAQQDAPAVDPALMLKALHSLQEQQTPQVKAVKQNAIQQINAAAGSPEKALGLWVDAIRGTQMQGAGDEGAQFRAWRESQGELYKERAVQNAVYLNVQWVALTLQRANGATVKELLPAVLNYTKELLADQAVMDDLEAKIKKDREAEQGAIGPKAQAARQQLKDDNDVRQTHDRILRQDVGSSVVAQWFKIGGFLSVDGWESNPGNYDGIFKNIVQPELRNQKDQHVFDYWDGKLQREAELATKSKLAFEVDKFNNLRRPALLWNRVQEFTAIGQKNRGLNEMFNLIKTYPTHPDTADWIATLQAALVPPPPDATTTPPAPASAGAPAIPGSAATTAPPAQ